MEMRMDIKLANGTKLFLLYDMFHQVNISTLEDSVEPLLIQWHITISLLKRTTTITSRHSNCDDDPNTPSGIKTAIPNSL